MIGDALVIIDAVAAAVPAVLSDGRLASSSQDHTVRIWDPAQCQAAEFTASTAVAVVVQLYDHHPDGFLKGSDAAQDVREIGRRLDQLGGFRAMLEAHKMFAAERPRMARNLEIVWDGIGTWQG